MAAASCSSFMELQAAYGVVLLALGLFLCAQAAASRSDFEVAREADRIIALPGQPEVEFLQYSGYITVNESHGRALFYWFIEAASDPQEKPLTLWLNGGPGCSSVGYGASQELGPFRVNVNGTGLHLHEYSWNREANLLFLDSPAGVGFSYTNVSSDLYNFGDKLTSEDAYTFLVRWFERFPEYKSHDFYIVGESYAGHYVPQLANLVYDRSKETSTYPFMNLKGFMVGNAITDYHHDWDGIVDYAWSHAVISDDLYNSTKTLCDFRLENWTDGCNTEVNKIFDEYDKINVYNLYEPICTTYNSSGLSMSLMSAKRASRPKPDANRQVLRGAGRMSPAGYDPCIEHYTIEYFNRPDVQNALHANITGIPYAWTVCNNILLNNWTDSEFSILPIYKKLIAAGLRIWVYSGDVDGRVPVTATRYTLNAMSLRIKTPWHSWYHDSQVGGWTQEFEGVMYVTVRGSGHLVPQDMPSQALALFSAFLAGQALPASK